MKFLFSITLVFSTVIVYAQDIESIIKSKPFEFNGSLSARVGMYTSNGLSDRIAPFSYGLNTRLNFSFYSFKIPVYFSIRDNSFRYGSTLPKLKISPRYKWASMMIGDVYTKFNPYVLDNRNMKGIAIKLTPGKFRFQAIYGKMKDLTSYRDTLLLGVNGIDSYSRKIVGLGLGFGSTRSFIDIYALKAWDSESKEFYAQRQASQKSNTILGVTSKFRLGRHISLQTNLGLSALTQNINAFGETNKPFNNNVAEGLVDLNITSNINYAGDIALVFRHRNIGINIKSRYIQPHFQPLSVAYINTDLIDHTLGGSIGFWHNKLLFNGRIGIQKNNLSKIDAITNQRFIYSFTSTIRLSSALFSSVILNNYSTQLQVASVAINNLYTYAVANSSANVNLSYKPSNKNGIIGHISLGKSNFTTISDQAEKSDRYESLFSKIDIGYNWPEIMSKLLLGVGFNKYDKKEITTNTYTVFGNYQRSIFHKKIDLKFSSRFTLIDLEDYREGTNWINQLSANYKLRDKTELAFHITYLNRSSYIKPTYAEIRGFISYRLKF